MSNTGRHNETERVISAALRLGRLRLKEAGALDGVTVPRVYDLIDDAAADILATIADVLELDITITEGARS